LINGIALLDVGNFAAQAIEILGIADTGDHVDD
jgi:hypothetical protein